MKEGYKKTKLGWIPEDWEVKRLGDVCEIKSSKRVYRKDYVEEGVPFYRSKEIIELSKGKSPEIELYISYDMYKDFKKKYGVPQCGDLLITSVGTIGKTWVSDGRNFYYKDGNITQIINNDKIDIHFISYLFGSNLLKQQYLGQSSGSAQVALTITKLNRLLFPNPPLPEQKKIASILSSVDEHIEEIENIIEDLKELKKGLMQKLLTGQYIIENGKLIKTKEFKKTKLGMLPEHWEVRKLGEVIKINPRKERFRDNKEVSFLAMADVTNDGKIANEQIKYYDEVKKGFTNFKNNDVLLAKITPCFENGKRALVQNLKNGVGFGSTEFHVLRGNDKLTPKYIYFLITTHNFKSKAELNMTGSAGQRRVPVDFLRNYKIFIPPLHEQQKIASILSTVDERIEYYQEQKEDYQQLKKGLMQQLLTGKIRVKTEN